MASSDPWVGKIEGKDFVRCQVCGLKATTLATHLRKHGLKAPEYRAQFPGARIRSEATEAKRKEAIKQAHAQRPTKGAKKLVVCPECEAEHEVSRFDRKDSLCPGCRVQREAYRWEGFEEGEDFVTCVKCGYRAENLTSHVQNAHPDLTGRYPGTIMAQNCAARDKTALKGKPLSPKTREKMSRNAGRWNKGLTKKTDERVVRCADRPEGFESWAKGGTKETSEAIKRRGQALSKTRATRHWTNKTEVILTRDQLLKFRLKNGKVSVGKAMAALGHAFVTIRRECRRHKLPRSHTNVAEHFVMETISRLLDGAEYTSEWSSMYFVNPETGRRFRFDGYFPDQDLLVEFHGRQHWEPVKFYENNGVAFEALQRRDRLKETLVEAHSSLTLLVIREDEPWQDEQHLWVRLSG